MLEILKLKIQIERHRLQRPKHLSEERFKTLQKEEEARNESDKQWTAYMTKRRGQLEELRNNEKGKIEINQQNDSYTEEASENVKLTSPEIDSSLNPKRNLNTASFSSQEEVASIPIVKEAKRTLGVSNPQGIQSTNN